MILLSAVVVAVLFTVAIYLMLSRNTQRVVIGFITLSNAVNLLVLAAAGVKPGAVAPLVDPYSETPITYMDPLPQAFILTAIVIGLGTASFLLAMAARAHKEMGTDDLSDTQPL